MSTIRVLHVIARMNVGGTARYVGDLVENIPGSALATGHVQGQEIEDHVVNQIETIRIPHLGRRISPINDFKALIELQKVIREIEPEVVHTHTFKAGLIGRLVGGSHKRVHTFHGHLFDDQSFSKFQVRVITSLEKWLARRTNVLVSVGERVGAELRESGIGEEKCWLSIPPGVKPLELINQSDARALLGLEEGVFLVGWLARVTDVKNPHLLVEIARQLPEIQFVMGGGGNLLDQMKLSAPRNLQILGWVDNALFWSAVDVAISTSQNEGMPIAIIEAQMAGKPVVASDAGSIGEVIVQGKTGFVCRSNPFEMSEMIIKISKNWTSENFLPQDLILPILRKFDFFHFIQTHNALYSSLLTAKKRNY